MSIASDALAEGLSVLTDSETAGETLIVLSRTGDEEAFEIQANVNRKPNRERETPGRIEFSSSKELSEIQYVRGAFGARRPIKVGESFKDQFGYFHKVIKAPTPLGFGFSVTCEQSE